MQAFSEEMTSGSTEIVSALDCPQCGTEQSVPVLEFNDVPIIPNTAWATEESALKAPLVSVRLVSCSSCELIYNATFDKDLIAYTKTYGNALHYSTRFQSYSQQIATHLKTQYNLQGKLVVEIGCGTGYFLNLLCRTADCSGAGFDPSFAADSQTSVLAPNVRIVREEFAGQLACRDANLICCRQVLEHISSPRAFLQSLRYAMGTDSCAHVFFEVPNVLFMLERNSFWDVMYEHCFYFTPFSLSNLFDRAGFNPTVVRTTFQDQYITLEAAARHPDSLASPVAKLSRMATDVWQRKIDGFSMSFERTIRHWRAFLQQCQEENKRVVVWGAGTKGIMFLNLLRCYTSEGPGDRKV
jgi:SAM-dependent methyltransferase